MTNKLDCDVVVAGGGLAGLGLAYQLKKQKPDINIVVLEKALFPRPKAIAKVGESTVEIGSHYLAHDLDLSEFLEKSQLRKFGIRMFFGDAHTELDQLDELGASQTFGIPTYQIDRGDLENTIQQRIVSMGVKVIDGADILDCELADKNHRVTFDCEAGKQDISCRWLLDASGRRALIKTKLSLGKTNEHRSNAIWFRVDKRIEIDTWTENKQWRMRCRPEGRRWLSTNHLNGPGYWVWIIPLASDVTSIGIVIDDEAFDRANISDEHSAMSWLKENQPMCYQQLVDARFLDFVVLKDYSHGCKQLFSHQGWAITGEAGYFADPLYSPGTDFIAIANTFISQLVIDDLSGKDVAFNALLFEKVFASIYQNTLSIYQEQYGGFGDRRMMGLKLLWDYTYYWGVLSPMFFGGVFSDIDKLRRLSGSLNDAQDLNQDIQSLFRNRAKKRMVLPRKGVFLDQYQIPCLREFNRTLMELDTSLAIQDIEKNILSVKQVASSVKDMLSDNPASGVSAEEQRVLGNYRELILA